VSDWVKNTESGVWVTGWIREPVGLGFDGYHL